jgi:cellulose synthase (UDP-forming)
MLRVSKKTDEKYFYALGARDTRLVRLLGVLGLVTTFFLVLGYVQFLHVSPLVALLFGPVMLIITLYYGIQYSLLGAYPGFDVRRHKQRIADFWHGKKHVPRIAVFIPAAGEDVDIVRGTLQAAKNINYPNFRVFMLDDSKDGLYEGIAKDLNAYYIRRKNQGEFKKAGNMNNALQYLDGYDHILVLDADFRARPEILHELVPYTGEDVGIIQSPQHFPLDKDTHARSKIEYGAGYIQQDFYRVTQVARNKFGAAICVGTSALYNVKAIRRVGGYEGVGYPRGWSHSEDVHTGLKMLNSYNEADRRYRIVYVPIQLAKGYCPDTHHSFYKQQNRWATGSMQLILSDKTVRSDKLSIMQRLIYGSNSLYYFYTMSLLLSPLYLLVLALSTGAGSWSYTLYFIPSLVLKHVVEPYVLRKQRAPLATSLVVISNAYTFLQAAVLLLMRKPLGWEATGASSKKKSAHFTHFKLAVTLGFIALYIVTLAVLILNERFQIGPSIFIIYIFLASFLTHLAFLFYTLMVSTKGRKRLTDRKFYAAISLSVIIVAVTYGALRYHARYDIVLKGYRVSMVDQREVPLQSGERLIDAYRRTVGDIKETVGL